jgi:hypothetical protein
VLPYHGCFGTIGRKKSTKKVAMCRQIWYIIGVAENELIEKTEKKVTSE